MPGILCAIRGGPESRAPIARAIELAHETGAPLYFLYVVNLDFLTHAPGGHVHTLGEELRRMGELIVLEAQERARAQGIPAQGLIRQGNVQEEIAAACRELGIQWLVLGRPRRRDGRDLFADEAALKAFEEEMAARTGAQIVWAGFEDASLE